MSLLNLFDGNLRNHIEYAVKNPLESAIGAARNAPAVAQAALNPAPLLTQLSVDGLAVGGMKGRDYATGLDPRKLTAQEMAAGVTQAQKNREIAKDYTKKFSTDVENPYERVSPLDSKGKLRRHNDISDEATRRAGLVSFAADKGYSLQEVDPGNKFQLGDRNSEGSIRRSIVEHAENKGILKGNQATLREKAGNRITDYETLVPGFNATQHIDPQTMQLNESGKSLVNGVLNRGGKLQGARQGDGNQPLTIQGLKEQSERDKGRKDTLFKAGTDRIVRATKAGLGEDATLDDVLAAEGRIKGITARADDDALLGTKSGALAYNTGLQSLSNLKTDQQLAINQDRRAETTLEFNMFDSNRNFERKNYEFDTTRADNIRNRNQDLDLRMFELELQKEMSEDARQQGMIQNLMGGLFSLGSLL